MVLGPYGVWILMQKRVKDLEDDSVERAKRDQAERDEYERQREVWWEKVDKLKEEIGALDKACAVATGSLITSVNALTARVDLHTSTNLSAIIGLVKNYNEMLEEAVSAIKDALREAKK